MERRELIALLGGAAALLPSQNGALAHPGKAPGNPLAGSWSFASSVNSRNDGTQVDRWGPNTRGMLMFDDDGHFAQIITGSESRMFGSKTYCAFGTYTFDAGAGALNLKFNGC